MCTCRLRSSQKESICFIGATQGQKKFPKQQTSGKRLDNTRDSVQQQTALTTKTAQHGLFKLKTRGEYNNMCKKKQKVEEELLVFHDKVEDMVLNHT